MEAFKYCSKCRDVHTPGRCPTITDIMPALTPMQARIFYETTLVHPERMGIEVINENPKQSS